MLQDLLQLATTTWKTKYANGISSFQYDGSTQLCYIGSSPLGFRPFPSFFMKVAALGNTQYTPSYAEFLELQKDTVSYETLMDLVNKSFDQELPIPLIVPVVGSMGVGLLTKYNPVSNEKIVRELLSTTQVGVSRYKIEFHFMNIYIKRDMPDEEIDFGICIQNGETGFKSFNYCAYFNVDGLELLFPLRFRRKHLGLVGDVLPNLKSALATMADLNTMNWLKNQSFTLLSDILKILDYQLDDDKKAQLQDIITLKTVQTWRDFLFCLSVFRNVKNCKTVAEEIINRLMEKAYESGNRTASRFTYRITT